MSKLSLIKFRSETILVGEIVAGHDHTFGENIICVKNTLALASFRRLRLNQDNLLEEITEADQVNPAKMDASKIRTLPMFHIPDEAVITTTNVEDAFNLQMPFHRDDIFLTVDVEKDSLIDRFYHRTVKEITSNKKLRDNLYIACSTDADVVAGVYDEKKTSKYFKTQE